MITKEQITECLKEVIYPGFDKNIVNFGFVKDIQCDQNSVKIDIQIVSANKQVASDIKTDILNKLEKFNINQIDINIIQPDEPKMQSNSTSGKNIAPNIKHFVMISSGKGGVGKSTTAVNLAICAAKEGKKVGLLDADIYGPNIPRMLGCQNAELELEGQRVRPILTHGIEMMSMGSIMDEGQSIIWRGAMVMKAIEQLLSDIAWGDLDILFIDMPPGTGDAQLTLAQSVPVSAGVCVTTPQKVALDDTSRSLDMFEKLHIPIAGVVENMSGFICPDTQKEYDIFGKGTSMALVEKYKTDLIAQIPIEPSVREGGDDGKPISFYHPNSETSKRYTKAILKILDFLDKNASKADNSAIQPLGTKSACH